MLNAWLPPPQLRAQWQAYIPAHPEQLAEYYLHADVQDAVMSVVLPSMGLLQLPEAEANALWELLEPPAAADRVSSSSTTTGPSSSATPPRAR